MTAKVKKTKISDEPGQMAYVEKIEEFEMERCSDISYKEVPVDGSSHFNDDIMQNIEPFNYDNLKPFSSDYLLGFLAEVYDTPSQEIFQNAEKRVKKVPMSSLEKV